MPDGSTLRLSTMSWAGRDYFPPVPAAKNRSSSPSTNWSVSWHSSTRDFILSQRNWNTCCRSTAHFPRKSSHTDELLVMFQVFRERVILVQIRRTGRHRHEGSPRSCPCRARTHREIPIAWNRRSVAAVIAFLTAATALHSRVTIGAANPGCAPEEIPPEQPQSLRTGSAPARHLRLS